jgi:hypothetical protein
MAEIYTKGSEKTRVLAPREGVFRQFDAGEWTELRVGAFFSNVGSAGPNANSTLENYVPSVASDYLLFGLKNEGQVLPGEAGSRFIGIRSQDNGSVQSNVSTGQQDSSGAWRPVTYIDTTTDLGAFPVMATTAMGGGDPTGATGYANFVGIKFTIQDRGLATQTVSVTAQGTSAIAGNDYSAEALRVLLNTTPFSNAPGVMTWNDGVSAYDIPDCIFFRSPLFNNCIRMSAWRWVRYAP